MVFMLLYPICSLSQQRNSGVQNKGEYRWHGTQCPKMWACPVARNPVSKFGVLIRGSEGCVQKWGSAPGVTKSDVQ